ncbi:MAG: membrane protein insertase YidC, partial [Arenicellales bacterium]
MDIQRLILFVALGLVSMMLMQNWQNHQLQKNPAAIEQGQNSQLNNQAASVPGVPSAPVLNSEGVPTAVAPSAIPNEPVVTTKGELIKITTDVLSIDIDTLGGSISYAGLIQHPIKMAVPNDPTVLLQDNALDRYKAESGLTGAADLALPNHHTQFSAQKLSYDLGSADSLEVPLSYTGANGIQYTKIYTFKRDSYRIDVRYQIQNNSSSPWQGNLYGHLLRTEPSDSGSGSYLTGQTPSFTGGAYYTPEELYNKLSFSDMGDEKLEVNAPSGWAAMLQHYFVSAWLPKADGNYRFYTNSNTRLANPEYKLGYLDLTPTSIAPGQSGEISTALYIGPKERDRLDAQGIDGLNLTVDYGWLTVIAEPLFWVMRKIHNVVGNWGWTIILITILLKAIFLPLSAASYKSMAKMKKLAPRLKTLKERYGDDKPKFQQEMMKVYKEEKVNPAGGCLPILVQIPVFIALYWVL